MAGGQVPGGEVQRFQYLVKGQVQGVGFRPFIYRLASRLRLEGFVRNERGEVNIEAQGEEAQLDIFRRALLAEAPPLALIHDVIANPIPPQPRAGGFCIEKSRSREAAQEAAGAGVTVDSAACPAYREELFDPRDRRYRYGLTNCTDCGPRYTILEALPYDRPNTTMKRFDMCDDCASEYERPPNRRFHAQPNACPLCGPGLQLVDHAGRTVPGDPVARAAAALAAGRIVAVKGLGGFHLAVRADRAESVGRLRSVKERSAKPFALMSRSMAEARRVVDPGEAASEQMQSARAPILLARRCPDAAVAENVAPGMDRLGVMLPYAPVHHLLFEALDPEVGALVMTSGNGSGEPLVIENREALLRLQGMCDAILWHDRPIRRCVDDSVRIDMGDLGTVPARRSRGYVPSPLPLPVPCAAPGLAVGGEQRNTIALALGPDAVLSQHLGDLTGTLNFELFRRTARDLCSLFDAEPAWVAHDLHPVYTSTRGAKALADRRGVPGIAVQHHHAHAAALLAEHGAAAPALVVVCDGTGYAQGGASWGGELLLADLLGFRRLAHLKPLRLAGGDTAAIDIRRCGLALLHRALGRDFGEHPAARELIPDPGERNAFRAMLERCVQCVDSSSAGRVFDGMAALLGICRENTFDGEAPMRLEAECPVGSPAARGTGTAGPSAEPGRKRQPLEKE